MATTAAELQVRTTYKDDASKGVQGLGTSFGKLTAAFGLASLAAVGLQKATSFVTNTVKGSIKAAQDAEASQVKVNAILKTLTGSYEEHAAVVEEASRVALQLGFDDEEAAESMAKLLQVTGDTTQAQEAMTVAMDLARFKGIRLEDATQAMTMAMNGNVRVLKQLGIEVPENAKRAEILGLVMQRVGGQAEAFGQTSAGASERFKNAMENLQESIGARVLPLVTKFFNVVSGFVASDKLQSWINEIGRIYRENLAPVIEGTVIPAFKSLADSIKPHIPLIMSVLKILFGAAGVALTGTLVVVSTALAGVGKIFDIVATSIEKVIGWVKQLIDWFGKAMAPINDFKNGVGGIVGGVGSGIGDAAGGIGGFFRDLFRAQGGPVNAGQGYIVGERGPEWFVPRQNGTVVPNGGGSNVTINVSGNTVRSDRDLQEIVAAVRSSMTRNLRLAELGS